MAKSNKEEPNTAPQPDQWYNLTLGSSFKDDSSTKKFCTLRYEFKPASIDKNQAGSLHKNKDNRVTLEFHNNQPGKPKVSFEGSSEDYKDNDAVLFFDGHTFRLERLHRAVKRLRHVRLPGESASSASAPPLPSAVGGFGPNSTFMEYSPPPPPPHGKLAKSHTPNKTLPRSSVMVEVERIDIGESESPGAKPATGRVDDDYAFASANPQSVFPGRKSAEPEEHLDLVIDDTDAGRALPNRATSEPGELKIGGFDVNLPSQNDTDDEIADVDVSDDEADKGPNAAEALRAQVMNEEGRGGRTSSSSESSGSGSSGSGSGSGSSSSDSEASDDDSVTSI